MIARLLATSRIYHRLKSVECPVRATHEYRHIQTCQYRNTEACLSHKTRVPLRVEERGDLLDFTCQLFYFLTDKISLISQLFILRAQLAAKFHR